MTGFIPLPLSARSPSRLLSSSSSAFDFIFSLFLFSCQAWFRNHKVLAVLAKIIYFVWASANYESLPSKLRTEMAIDRNPAHGIVRCSGKVSSSG